LASWTYWSNHGGGPVGMCRGVMELSSASVTSREGIVGQVPVVAQAPVVKESLSDMVCYDLFSTMAWNNLLQSFPNNPDSQAEGFATCTLCTDGKLTCNALVYGGKTPLIASHIHLASNKDGKTGSGEPVFSFCGDNADGLIQLDPPYPEMCAAYMGGNSNNPNMMGVFLNVGANNDMTLADRVRHIGEHPEEYYMNFHSLASWTYWSNHGGGPVGMCRGVMEKSTE